MTSEHQRRRRRHCGLEAQETWSDSGPLYRADDFSSGTAPDTAPAVTPGEGATCTRTAALQNAEYGPSAPRESGLDTRPPAGAPLSEDGEMWTRFQCSLRKCALGNGSVAS